MPSRSRYAHPPTEDAELTRGDAIVINLTRQALAHAIETADSLSGPKMAAALDSTSNLPTVVPGLNLTFTATPSVHNGYPLSYFTECTMQTGPYDLRYAAG